MRPGRRRGSPRNSPRCRSTPTFRRNVFPIPGECLRIVVPTITGKSIGFPRRQCLTYRVPGESNSAREEDASDNEKYDGHVWILYVIR